MNTVVATTGKDSIVESVITAGDLSKLPPAERTRYYAEVCASLGLNSLTKPFEYITLNGKLTLYARKDATDQLRKLHMVSVQIVSREQIGDVYAVTARATDARGRTDESIGAVSITNLKGDALCNALMKAETKAKRRVTLSICGLGMLDEAELDAIPQTTRIPEPIADEPESVEAEPEPVRQVKLEGEQPADAQPGALPANLKGQAGQVIALAKALKWGEAEVIGLIQEAFGTIVFAGRLAGTLEFMTGDEHRELIRILKGKLGGK